MPVALDVRNLRVTSLDLDFHEVSWSIRNTVEDVLDYTFQILRSESPEGPFEAISAPFSDRYLFIDNVLQVAHRWRIYHYKLRVTNKQDQSIKDFGPVSKTPEPDLIAQELRRHMQLLFQEFAGRRNWVLPVRTFGQRCSCWNTALNKQTRSGCVLCFDTGFIRGYIHPIEVWGQIDPNPKADQATNVGKLQQSNTTGRFGYYPPLKPDDLIIEPENRRWRVIAVSQVEFGRAAVSQEVQLHEIPSTDVEFAIPLNMELALRDMWAAPIRNYSNPMNLQNFEEQELPRLYDLYSLRKP